VSTRCMLAQSAAHNSRCQFHNHLATEQHRHEGSKSSPPIADLRLVTTPLHHKSGMVASAILSRAFRRRGGSLHGSFCARARRPTDPSRHSAAKQGKVEMGHAITLVLAVQAGGAQGSTTPGPTGHPISRYQVSRHEPRRSARGHFPEGLVNP
jgi:hypothetical protein